MPRKSQKTSIPIMVPDKNHKFAANFETFDKMLLQDDIKEWNIAVVSIAGAPRKGKSFLMNFCAHYLEMMYNSNGKSNTGTWLKKDDVIPSSFVWAAGTTRVTTGIQMWPEIFHATVNGEKVAILLLDTQGTFDKVSTPDESVFVFALSTILSSVQIYNVSSAIDGVHLEHLQLFTEYGRLARNNENSEKPFQQIQFLIRDWCALGEHPYGAEGGRKYIDHVLEISDDQAEELKSIRKAIKSCFADIRCFLMPDPGKRMRCDTNFQGSISAIDPEFVTCLQEFIPSLFSPENLIVKEMAGRRIKVKEFVGMFKDCVNTLLTSDGLPQLDTMFSSTVKTSNKIAYNEALSHYNEKMADYEVEKSGEYVTTKDLQHQHDYCKSSALELFDKSRCKMGGNEIREEFYRKLKESIDVSYGKHSENVKKTNQKVTEQTCESALSKALLEYRELLLDTDMEFEEKQRRSLKVFEDITRSLQLEEPHNVKTAHRKLLQEVDNAHKDFLEHTKKIEKDPISTLKVVGYAGTIISSIATIATVAVFPVGTLFGGILAAVGAIATAGSAVVSRAS